MKRTLNAGCRLLVIWQCLFLPLSPQNIVPEIPKYLPFKCKADNNAPIKERILEHFASPAFNNCLHRPLPRLTSPPVEIHFKDNMVPKSVQTTATILIHWQKQVKEDLYHDEALCVIERLPYGELVMWCHVIVVTRKHGTLRRMVDLCPLNKHYNRGTVASESPFNLARRIPLDSWNTVSDDQNGLHSVPLRESDRPYTTSIIAFPN